MLQREFSAASRAEAAAGELQEEGGFHLGGADGEGGGGADGDDDAELTSPVMGAIAEMQPAAALTVMSYMTLQVGAPQADARPAASSPLACHPGPAIQLAG